MERGTLRVGRLLGAPLRLHWSLPLAPLLLSGGRWAPGAWLGVLALLLLHELGHALLVRRVGLTLLGIDLSGLGGRCRFAGEPTPRQRAVVAWGGVLAQALVLAPALLVRLAFDVPPGLGVDLLDALVRANLILIALNLLPVPPLDGAEAWRLVRLPRRRSARGQTLRQAFDEAARASERER